MYNSETTMQQRAGELQPHTATCMSLPNMLLRGRSQTAFHLHAVQKQGKEPVELEVGEGFD